MQETARLTGADHAEHIAVADGDQGGASVDTVGQTVIGQTDTGQIDPAGTLACPAARRPATVGVAAPRRTASAAATIYRNLRAEIIALRRLPGEALAEKEIAQRYGVSRTPVREAVLRLADEGLIEIFPQSGTFVARIPLSDLPEAIAIRRTLEVATTRNAAALASRSQIATLRANLELQREKEGIRDYDGFHVADEAFHALLAEAAGHPGFWTVTLQVKVHIDRYRRLTLPARGRMAHIIEEHTAIVDAIEARNEETAVSALNHHLDDLERTIDEVRSTYPQYFVETGDPDDLKPA